MAKNIVQVAGPMIPVGAALSTGVDLTMGRPICIYMPVDWTPAELTFRVSVDGAEYRDLYDDQGREVHVICEGGSHAVALPAGVADGIAFVQFRSGTSLRPIPQQSDRLFSIIIDSTAVMRSPDIVEPQDDK